MPPTKAKGADAASSSRTDADDASSGKVSGGPAELPLHLTEKILCSISPLASARLATVCKSWAATISKRLARPIPHLFVSLPADNKSDRRGVVFSVVEMDHGPAVIPNRVRLADTNGLRCIGAMPSGYLAFANWFWCESSVVLVNPITGARQIVDVEKIRQNPVLAAGGADSFIVSTGADELGLWLRPGGAGEWSKWTVAAAGHRPDGVMLVALRNGCFYVLDRDGYVFFIDATAPPTPTPLRMEKLPVASLFDQFVVPPSSSPVKGHFVEADGEVLFVRRVLAAVKEDRGIALCHHDVVREDYFSIVGFEVYRLDVKDHRWTKAMKLAGDRTLFVSPRSSLVVMRSSETEGCRSNCIYFVDEKRYCSRCNLDDGNTWGVYSMEDGEVLFKHAVTGQGPCSEATWFLPRVVSNCVDYF